MGVATVGWGGGGNSGGGQQLGGWGGLRCSHHKYKTPKLFELKQS